MSKKISISLLTIIFVLGLCLTSKVGYSKDKSFGGGSSFDNSSFKSNSNGDGSGGELMGGAEPPTPPGSDGDPITTPIENDNILDLGLLIMVIGTGALIIRKKYLNKKTA